MNRRNVIKAALAFLFEPLAFCRPKKGLPVGVGVVPFTSGYKYRMDHATGAITEVNGVTVESRWDLISPRLLDCAGKNCWYPEMPPS